LNYSLTSGELFAAEISCFRGGEIKVIER